MNCYICKSYAKIICNCISPSALICDEHIDQHLSGKGKHVGQFLKPMDRFPILFKDLKVIKIKITSNSYLEIKKIEEKVNKYVKEINNDLKNLQNTLEKKELKKTRLIIIENSLQEIKNIQKQASNSIKEINNFMKNLKKNFEIPEKNFLEMIYKLKSLILVKFEDFTNKYFYRVLKDEDGKYEGTTGLGQDDTFIKEGKGIKHYRSGLIFEGE